MGFRTVVMLSNDFSDVWSRDPKLGEKIQTAMNYANASDPDRSMLARLGNYGRVVECTHADTQTLVRLDHYTGFEPLAYASRSHGPSTEEDSLQLLKRTANRMGYRLVKMPSK